jgi:hypothetical protein
VCKLRQLPVILLSNVAYWQQTSSARRQNIGGYGTGANQGGDNRMTRAEYDGDNPLRLANEVDAALAKTADAAAAFMLRPTRGRCGLTALI